MRASVGFLVTTPVLMLIALMTEMRGLVVASAVAGSVAAVAVLVPVALRRKVDARGVFTALGALAAGAGYVSWFVLEDASVNLAGPAAVVIGTVVVAIAAPRSGRDEAYG